MQKNLRKILSVLLAFSMVFSLTAHAAGANRAEDQANPSGSPGSGSRQLQLEAIDPSTLNIQRLGQVAETEEPESETLPYGLNDPVRVSIVLDQPSALDAGYSIQGIGSNSGAAAYRNSLKEQQNRLAQKISAEILGGEPLDVKWNITLAGNMISANVPYGKIEAIRQLNGVAEVTIENRYDPVSAEESASPNMVSARDMTGTSLPYASEYTGAGSRLAIIDTGLDWEHQSFSEEAFLHAIEELEAEGKEVSLMTAADIPSTGLNGRGIYLNAKIPYAYNYVDNNTTVNHTSDTQEEHGSHVSGIAAANRYLKIEGEFVDAAEAVGVVGQAPDAQVFIMKVFGSGGGAYDSDYMVAIEDALVLGADSVNLSLGSSTPGSTTMSTATYRNIFRNLVNKGMVVSISAGNNTSWDSQKQLYYDDINLFTGGSPGSYANALTVASIDDSGSKAPFLLFNGELELRYTEGGGAANNARMTTAAGTYDYVYIDAVGTAAQFALVDVEGKVAICNRGETSFYEKANAAVAAGAVAVVIVNNQAGTISMALDGYSYTNPVVSIKQAEGLAIKALSERAEAEGLTYYTGTIEIGGKDNMTPMAYFEMSSFSSWGVPGSLILKPEITAPGGAVYSLNGYHRNASGGGYSGGHDAYETMSGTSMAAPQITGLTAVFGEHYRRDGLAELTGQPLRTLAQSLLMSTAVPVIEEASNYYYSLLNQGSGLANINAAVQARTYILMHEAATRSAEDGKVKAELGDDPSRTGTYSYSFTVNNFGSEDITYEVHTDLFTQALESNNTLLSHQTKALESTEIIDWVVGDYARDVNQDKLTNLGDVQAILDTVTGAYPEDAAFNAELADMDGDGLISSYDAYLLADKLENPPVYEGYVVPAGSKATVTVTLKLTDAQKAALDAERPGAYVEGFTFLEGEDGVTHSIPILAFYGSWTDPSMFDAVTYAEKFYGSTQSSYFNASNTNGLQIRYNGSQTADWFVGNQYVKEDAFPADRLALNNQAVIYQARYNLIRQAGTIFSAVIKEDGTVLNVANVGSNMNAAYYNTQASTPSWQSTNTSQMSLNVTVGSLGLEDGEKFTAGAFALPEYYAFEANDTNDSGYSLSQAQIRELLAAGNYGKGAYIGYTFAVDNAAPIVSAVINEDGTVTVTAQDNQFIAALGVLDVSGRNSFIPLYVPEQAAAGSEVTLTFDPVEIGAAAANAATIFVADYAGNEYAAIIRTGDGPILMEKDAYVLTDVMEAGKEYLIANSAAVGGSNILTRNNTSAARTQVTVLAANTQFEAPYIDGEDIPATAVWTVAEGFKISNGGNYLRANGSWSVSLQIAATDSNNIWTWDAENHRLSVSYNNRTYYLRYSNNNFSINTATNSVYLFEKVTYTEEFDPDAAQSVTITPASAELYAGNTVQLQAEVLPMTVADRSVSWSSSDEEIATVDENGLVTAVGGGTATITAESNQTEGIVGTATITVTAVTPLPGATVNAQLSDDTGNNFVKIDLGNLSTEVLGTAAGAYFGGGRSEDLIFGMDNTNSGTVYFTYITEEGYVSEIMGYFNSSTYNARDAAHVPAFSAVVDDVTYTEEYGSIYVANSYLLMITEEGALTGWNASGYRAIAYAGTDVEAGAHYYYILNSNGQLLSAMLSVSEEEPLVFDEETGEASLNLMLSTSSAQAISGLSSQAGTFSANYMSMTVLETEDYYGLLIANSSNRRIYFVDLTAETLSAVLVAGFSGSSLTTLYNDDYDAEVIPIETEEGEDALARMKAAVAAGGETFYAQKIAVPEKAAPEAAGGLNAIRHIVSNTTAKVEMELITDEADPSAVPVTSKVMISLVEEETAGNGKYVLTYDPSRLSYSDAQIFAASGSVKVDEEAGTVTLAFADAKLVEGGRTIANVFFELPECESSVITVSTAERNDVLSGIEEDFDVAVQGPGHKWGAPEWTWTETEDGYAATAKFTCETNEEHILELEANIVSGTETFCEEPGAEIYVATVELNGRPYVDIFTVELPPAGHAWGEPEWTWTETEDGFVVSAKFICANDEEHIRELEAEVTVEIMEASCEEAGLVIYTASVELDEETYTDVKEVVLEATGHVYGAPEWTWTKSEDGYTAAAVFTCEGCEDEQTVEALVTKAYDSDTKILTFTATAVFEGEEYTDTLEIDLSSIGYNANLELKENFNVNFYVRNLDAEFAADVTVKWTFDGEAFEQNLGEVEPLEDGRYKIVLAEVFSYQMTKQFEINVEYLGVNIREITYSVQQYFDSRLTSNDSDELKAIYRAALDYGAAAQLYFDGKEYEGGVYDCDTEHLANANSNPDNTPPTVTKPVKQTLKDGSISGFTAKSASLVLGSNTEIRVSFLYEGNIEDLVISCDNGKTVSEPVLGADGRYGITIKGLCSYELCKDYQISFVRTNEAGEAAETFVLTYSPYTYAANKWDNTDADLARLMQAFVAYGDAAYVLWGED